MRLRRPCDQPPPYEATHAEKYAPLQGEWGNLAKMSRLNIHECDRCVRDDNMTDWKSLIDAAMAAETSNIIEAHGLYGQASQSALMDIQGLMSDLEAAQMMETLYGALVAYSQQVMTRMKAEDPEVGGVDHAFRAGQAYGVSCVLNHMVDQLVDTSGATALAAYDDFSDSLHDEIIVQARGAGLTIELLGAKGELLE